MVLVGGGVGVASLVSLAEEIEADRRRETWAFVGARTADRLWGVEELRRCGVKILTAVEDGDHPFQGTVLDLLRKNREAVLLRRSRLFVCGPSAMLRAVAMWALDNELDCQVSLESPMACGIGICFSCVAKVRGPSGTWDYRRTCVEGPVFDAGDVEF
jgi:dihydroorotate dehydrogenase electron transfer subunit